MKVGLQDSKIFGPWKGKVPTDDAWIDLDAVERYESISTLDSTGSSLLPPGENDEDIQPRPWRIYHHWRR